LLFAERLHIDGRVSGSAWAKPCKQERTEKTRKIRKFSRALLAQR
jgi:hypothetical protein